MIGLVDGETEDRTMKLRVGMEKGEVGWKRRKDKKKAGPGRQWGR